MTASPASAHYVYQGGWTYRTDYDCTAQRSEISHGRYGDGYSKSDVAAWERTPISQCTYPSWRPGGYIRTKAELWKWLPAQNRWSKCYQTGWFYNTKTKQQISLQVTYKGGVKGGKCGPGYYGTVAYGHQNNGGWHGGAIWSGYHYLPI
ncbi:hypothetical protein [Streptomyces lavendofoliae]|uniref:hypothetical protein n=1 Tax=Streptomyces lavendofoliae TaxID=67314 RepID=UPI003D8BE104